MKALLVTGATVGIGRAYALALAARGDCSLILIGRDVERLRRTAVDVEAIWRKLNIRAEVEILAADLADPAARATLCARIHAARREIGGVYHCAGAFHRGEFALGSYETYRRMVEVNCLAAVQLVHAFLPEMAARRQGEIVLISSRWAFLSAPYLSTYSGCKSFLLHWGTGLARELRGGGVRVMVQCPGHTVTETSAQRPRVWRWLPGRTPEQVAAGGLRAVARARVVAIDGWVSWWLLTLARGLPTSWAGAILKRALAPRKDGI